MNILIIEDDVNLRNCLSNELKQLNYQVAVITNFNDVIKQVGVIKPDLILLDVNLPNFDGYQVAQLVKKEFKNIKIIILTSRDTPLDEVYCFNVGCDDFIKKPYNISILDARIKRLLTMQEVSYNINGIEIDLMFGAVKYKDKKIDITKMEMKIIKVLIDNQNNVVDKNMFINHLWQTDEFVDENTLVVSINRLRKKMESIGIENFILTKRGIGYYLCV